MALSQKLTSRYKQNLSKALLDKALGEEELSLENDKADLALRVYNSLVPKSLRTRLSDVPKEWLEMSRVVDFSVGSSKSRQSHKRLHLPDDILVPVPTVSYHERRLMWSLPNSCPLAKELKALEKRQKLLQEKRSKLSAKVRVALLTPSTLSSLVFAWPEIEEIAKAVYIESQNKQANVPKFTTSELARELGV